MVQLEAKMAKGGILISTDSFGHLLSCLDNQKFIGGVNADALELSTEDIHGIQDENQAAIDDFNRQCRKVWLSCPNAGRGEAEDPAP